MKSLLLGALIISSTSMASASNTACKNLKALNISRIQSAKLISCDTIEASGTKISRPDYCLIKLGEEDFGIWDNTQKVLGFRGGFFTPGPQEYSAGSNIGLKEFNKPTIKFAVKISNLYGQAEYYNDPWFGDRKLLGSATFQCR